MDPFEQLPDSVRDLVKSIVVKNMASAQTSINEVEKSLRALPDFPLLVDILVRRACQVMVYATRSAINVKILQDERNSRAAAMAPSGMPAPSSKTHHTLVAYAKGYEGMYGYAIDGHALGDMTGDDLAAFIQKTESELKSKAVNVDLVKWCQTKGVRGAVKVRDRVKPAEISRALERIRRGAGLPV